MVLRVYRVDCYFHFFVFGFSQDLQFRRGIAVPRFFCYGILEKIETIIVMIGIELWLPL